MSADHAALAGMFAAGEPIFESRPGLPICKWNGGSSGNWNLAVPVHSTAPLTGGLFAAFDSPPAHLGQMMSAASSFAPLATICLKHSSEIDQVGHLARTDPLTGCLNRATILSDLGAEVVRSERRGHPLSICFLDLDRFKAVNDRFGHLAGDQVLAEVGSILRAWVREYDRVGRFGGDEFLVVMPETADAEAMLVGRRLAAALEHTTAASPGPSVGAKFGIAERRHGGGANELLAVADRELRRIKQAAGL